MSHRSILVLELTCPYRRPRDNKGWESNHQCLDSLNHFQTFLVDRHHIGSFQTHSCTSHQENRDYFHIQDNVHQLSDKLCHPPPSQKDSLHKKMFHFDDVPGRGHQDSMVLESRRQSSYTFHHHQPYPRDINHTHSRCFHPSEHLYN